MKTSLTFWPSLTLNASLEVGSPVWTKVILPSSRSFRENKSMALQDRCNPAALSVLLFYINYETLIPLLADKINSVHVARRKEKRRAQKWL